MPPRFRKKDNNQSQIEEELRAKGFSVFSIHIVGENVPDIVVGRDGLNMLIEIKSGRNKLRSGQSEFFKTWSGHVIVARTTQEIVDGFEQYLKYMKGLS